MMGFKMIVLLLKVWFQSQVDFFIMDREKKRESAGDAVPNAWRQIFVANELNEI